MAIDGSLPPWLERNVAPRESFDPTPWLQARFQREVQKQKLPLELQQMELANKAHKLSIEHQGMMNDQFNQELNTYEQELPKLRDWMEQSQTNPGLAPPPVLSQKGKALIVDRQKINSETALGMAYKQRMATQNKIIADIIEAGGTVGDPGPDGLYDLEDLGQRKEAALDKKNQREIDREIKKGTAQANARSQLAVAEQQAIAEARAKFNPDLVNAQEISRRRDELRASEANSALRSTELPMTTYYREMTGDTFDANAEAAKQARLRDEIDVLERSTGHGAYGRGPQRDIAIMNEMQNLEERIAAANQAGRYDEAAQLTRNYNWLASTHSAFTNPRLSQSDELQVKSMYSQMENLDKLINEMELKATPKEMESAEFLEKRNRFRLQRGEIKRRIELLTGNRAPAGQVPVQGSRSGGSFRYDRNSGTLVPQ